MSKLTGWGVVGLSNAWMAFEDDGDLDREGVGANGYGVRRILDPGVLYREQPLIDEVPRWIEKPGSRRRIYDMEWGGEEPPNTFSLPELQRRLATCRKTLTAGDGDLALLDDSVRLLVETVTRLHASGVSLGFFQPDSARFWHRHDGTHAVVLPDVGFAWDDAGGLLEPDWLSSTEFDFLFDDGARSRNEGYREQMRCSNEQKELRRRVRETASFAAEDVRILARFIALTLVGPEELARWCGRSKALLTLPGKDRAPDTEAPIWDDVIAPALAGQITTCKELALRLAGAKPSEHFLFTPPRPPWRGWAILRTVATGATGLALLIGLGLLRDRIWPQVPPPPYCDRVPAGSALYDDLVGLQKLQAVAVTDAGRYSDYWESLIQCLHDHDMFEECDRDCLEGLVAAHFQRLHIRAEQALNQLEVLPRPTTEECEALRGIADDFVLTKTAVESYVTSRLVSVSEIQQQLAIQLRLRGCESVAAKEKLSKSAKQE